MEFVGQRHFLYIGPKQYKYLPVKCKEIKTYK